MAITILRNFGMGRNMMEEQIMHSVAGMCEYLDKLEDKTHVNMFFPLLVSQPGKHYDCLEPQRLRPRFSYA